MGTTTTLENPPADLGEVEATQGENQHLEHSQVEQDRGAASEPSEYRAPASEPQEYRAPASEPKEQPARSAASGRPPIFWVTAAAAALMIIGGFGTWASATTFIGTFSLSGTSGGDGWFLIAGGAIAAGLLFWEVAEPKAWKPIAIGAAALLGLVPAVIDFGNIHDVTGAAVSQGVLVQVGWGLYVSVIASAALLAAAIYTYVKRPYGGTDKVA